MGLGETIKEMREKRNMSKAELARSIEVSPAYITMIENGKKTNPSMDILKKIALVLKIPLYDLITTSVEVDINENRNKANESIEKDIDKTNILDFEKNIEYETHMNSLYEKYFIDLFIWKTSRYSGFEFFEFILSLAPMCGMDNLKDNDIEELAIFFLRLFEMKASERKYIDSLSIDNAEILEDEFITIKNNKK